MNIYLYTTTTLNVLYCIQKYKNNKIYNNICKKIYNRKFKVYIFVNDNIRYRNK